MGKKSKNKRGEALQRLNAQRKLEAGMQLAAGAEPAAGRGDSDPDFDPEEAAGRESRRTWSWLQWGCSQLFSVVLVSSVICVFSCD